MWGKHFPPGGAEERHGEEKDSGPVQVSVPAVRGQSGPVHRAADHSWRRRRLQDGYQERSGKNIPVHLQDTPVNL